MFLMSDTHDAVHRLLKAALCGDLAIVEELLEAGTDPNAMRENTGSAALHRATSRCHVEVSGGDSRHRQSNLTFVFFVLFDFGTT